jgi:hypothetical protein
VAETERQGRRPAMHDLEPLTATPCSALRMSLHGPPAIRSRQRDQVVDMPVLWRPRRVDPLLRIIEEAPVDGRIIEYSRRYGLHMRLCKPDIARLPKATPMEAVIPHDVMGANGFHSGFLSCMCGKDKFTAA